MNKNTVSFYQNGINRLSFGVQAVQDNLLQKNRTNSHD